MNHNLKFDSRFWRELWALLKPYWASEEKYSACFLLFLNIACALIGVRASVALNTFYRDFYDALQNTNTNLLTGLLLQFVIIVTALILSFGYSVYFNGLLSVRWRRWLTKNYINTWLSNHNHYHAQQQPHAIDNPDQRISEDLKLFPELTLDIFLLFVRASLTLVAFSYILWHLSVPTVMFSTPINIPGYLCWSALAYALIGTLITAMLGKTLAKFHYRQQRFNADLRYSLVRLRKSSEQIAFYRGETTEEKQLNNLFNPIFTNFIDITRVKKNLALFSNGYNTVAFIFGMANAIPLYLAKKIQLGGVVQIAGAFSSVIGALSMLINEYSKFADWRAVIHRLAEFNHSISFAKPISKIQVNTHEHHGIKIENLTVTLPNGNPLIGDFNITLSTGDSLLLQGQTGLGKSTLLRAIAGLWPHGTGQIHLPKTKHIFFLPQKPYLPLGTLKEILLYPDHKNIDDSNTKKALEFCGLNGLYHQLHETKNWGHELSLGEQQLITFAQIFLHKPDIIFLDEATSALDEKKESYLHENLKRTLPKTIIVTVGNRNSLKTFHDNVIQLA